MGKTAKTTKTQKKTAAKPKPAAKSSAVKAPAPKGSAKKETSKKVAPKKDAAKDAAEAKVSKKAADKPVAGPSRKGATESAATTAPAAKPSAKGAAKVSSAKGGTGMKTAGTKGAGAKGAGAKGEASKGGGTAGGGKGAAAASTPPSSSAPSTKAPAAAAAESGAETSVDKKKAGPKGITIVQPKPNKPSKPKPKFQLPQGEPLLKPGAKWKPLIPSGPGAPPRHDLETAGQADGAGAKPKLSKKELEKYRQVLLAKRGELVGDVRNMESEALLQNSGSLSHTPQHMAEQGTDVFDQSLNLDLAAVDRTLIREIDAALERIDAGTFGVCELTGKLISTERLDELPWTRYSIEAARERERRSYQP